MMTKMPSQMSTAPHLEANGDIQPISRATVRARDAAAVRGRHVALKSKVFDEAQVNIRGRRITRSDRHSVSARPLQYLLSFGRSASDSRAKEPSPVRLGLLVVAVHVPVELLLGGALVVDV